MTIDKEIIIDGVNVARCIYYGSQENCTIRNHQKCSSFLNCYYKQLQRKEQECEELKKQLDTAKINYANEMDYPKMYKQALEKVSSILIALDNILPHECLKKQGNASEKAIQDALNIINEVKNSNNEQN